MSDIRIFIFFRHLSDVSIFYIYLHVSNVRIFFFFPRTCQMYTIFYFYLHESSYVRILKKNLFAPFRCRHFSIFSRVKWSHFLFLDESQYCYWTCLCYPRMVILYIHKHLQCIIYSENCQNRTSMRPTFAFGMERCRVYTG